MTQPDYEGELGVVIGRPCRDVAEADALDYVAGYLAVNDVSARDWQFRTGQWSLGKAPDTFCPIGPALVTADEIPDVQNLGLRTVVSGEVLQEGHTSNMIFTVAHLIWDMARIMTLEPGDIIATGTPSGVGFAQAPAGCATATWCGSRSSKSAPSKTRSSSKGDAGYPGRFDIVRCDPVRRSRGAGRMRAANGRKRTQQPAASKTDEPGVDAAALEAMVAEHLADSEAIIRTIAAPQVAPAGRRRDALPRYLQVAGLADYQREIYRRFSDVITIPAVEYISKTPHSWLIAGDHRAEVAARVEKIIERHGLGVGMLVLHAQQMHSRHILLEPGDRRAGAGPGPAHRPAGRRAGENILYVPIRKHRGDRKRLAELNITKPPELWNKAALVTHEQVSNAQLLFRGRDQPCRGGRAHRGAALRALAQLRAGLHLRAVRQPPVERPFPGLALCRGRCDGPPAEHEPHAHHLLRPGRDDARINTSIAEFFAGTDIRDLPIIDGVSNGWAGNTIYHQHFQFFRPEYPCPITDEARLAAWAQGSRRTKARPQIVLKSDDIRISRLPWETPVYKITADDSINIGLVGNDMAGTWRLLGGSATIPYRTFPEDYVPKEGSSCPSTRKTSTCRAASTAAAYILLRDKRRVDYRPGPDEYINREAGRRAQPKTNIAVLEATGTVIVDDNASFEEMRSWTPEEITAQVSRMIAAIHPDEKQVRRFEKNIRGAVPGVGCSAAMDCRLKIED